MVRALRDGRPIVNVDVVINQQNVAVLDKIVELCIQLGVTEFDLLHVIPQAAAFEHREQLFYDVREHLPVLHKVFRLNRHPRFVVWTNRFPVSYLEGLEDLIQDPHKMLDEVNGRRFQLRRYIDEGTPLECRHPERCPHCFIEPFCTTLDRVIAAQNAQSFEVYWVGEGVLPAELPFGAKLYGVAAADLASLPRSRPLFARVRSAERLPSGIAAGRPLVLVAETPEQLEAWLGAELPENVSLDIELSRRTAPWLIAHRAELGALGARVRIHQPSHEQLAEATERDVRDPRTFFRELALPVLVSGLPPCLAPGATWIEERQILDAKLFDPVTGRLDLRETARHHVARRYRAKSVRCADCALNERCEGAHINMVRDQGLGLLTPLTAALDHRLPPAAHRLARGAPPEPVAPSLPGFPGPRPAPEDPLAVLQREREARRAARRALPLIQK
jgi:hypothetical protein